MILREKYQINYIKREPQSGSHFGMRYTLMKQDDQLVVIYYPEPLCLDATPEESKASQTFELSNAGLDQAIVWLNEAYENNQEQWQLAYETRNNPVK